jgi:phosphatidylglycerophosphate synthase
MAELGERTSVGVSWVGKLKTGFQMTAIGMMIWEAPWPILPWYDIGFVLLLVASVLTLYSMVQYLLAAWPMMKDSPKSG